MRGELTGIITQPPYVVSIEKQIIVGQNGADDALKLSNHAEIIPHNGYGMAQE